MGVRSGGGIERRRGGEGPITTERQETLKFRAVMVNTRRGVSLLHGTRRGDREGAVT